MGAGKIAPDPVNLIWSAAIAAPHHKHAAAATEDAVFIKIPCFITASNDDVNAVHSIYE